MSGPALAPSGALTGALLVEQAGGQVAEKLGEELMALLRQTRPENKKKAKKAVSAAKKKEAEAAAASVSGAKEGESVKA